MTTTVTVVAAPGGPDGSESSSPTVPVGPSAATGLVPLVAPPQNAPIAASALGLSGSATNSLGATVGGSTPLASDSAATAAPIAPVPLAAASALPPVQVSPAVLLASTSETSGTDPASIVLPQNTPEPGTLALFAMVSAAVLLQGARRRVRDVLRIGKSSA